MGYARSVFFQLFSDISIGASTALCDVYLQPALHYLATQGGMRQEFDGLEKGVLEQLRVVALNLLGNLLIGCINKSLPRKRICILVSDRCCHACNVRRMLSLVRKSSLFLVGRSITVLFR